MNNPRRQVPEAQDGDSGGGDEHMVSPYCVIDGATSASSAAAAASTKPAERCDSNDTQVTDITGRSSSSSMCFADATSPTAGGENSLTSIRHYRRVHLLEQALHEGDISLIHSLTVSPLDQSPMTLTSSSLHRLGQEGDASITHNLTVSPLNESSSSFVFPPAELQDEQMPAVDEQEEDQQEQQMFVGQKRKPQEQPSLPGPAPHPERKRSVHFAQRLYKRKSKWCRDDLDQSVWYNSDEIRAMALKARCVAKRSSKERSSYADAVQAVFLDTCGAARFMKNDTEEELGDSATSSLSASSSAFSVTSSGSVESKIGWDREAVQDLLRQEHRPGTLRGLECKIIPLLKDYRNFHAKSLLALQVQRRQSYGQSSQKSFDQEVTLRLLRAQSLQTSRPSRALARIFAQSDANEVAAMIRNELGR